MEYSSDDFLSGVIMVLVSNFIGIIGPIECKSHGAVGKEHVQDVNVETLVIN